jgi:hypothetical protein
MRMKTICLLFLLGLAGASVSCRVNVPVDPATMKPSCKFCPQYLKAQPPSFCKHCGNEVIVGSK